MSSFYYLDVQLKLRDDTGIVLTQAYFQGSIQESLNSFFGELGGQTDWQLLKFDAAKKRAILKVPEQFLSRTRAAITLIGQFQNVPCHFQVLKTSREALDL